VNERQRACFDAVRQHVAPGGYVLELSGGKGDLLAALRAAGYRVRGTNYSRYDTAPEGVEIDTGVDLRRPLPYPDGSFDAVVLCDVIEHVSDHPAVIAETARVLRAGGHSVILTPNVNRLSSRLQYLWTGFQKPKRGFIGFDVPPEKEFAFHNFPPSLPVFLYQTHARGLELVRLSGSVYKAKNLLLWPLLAPGIVAATWLLTHVAERNLRRHGGSLVFRAMVSFPALCAESWVATHRKRDGGLSSPPGVAEPTRLPEWHEPAAPPRPR
jgi:SAM-dependent methyltransferase